MEKKLQLFIKKYSYTIKTILSAKTRWQNRKCYQTNALGNTLFHKWKQETLFHKYQERSI